MVTFLTWNDMPKLFFLYINEWSISCLLNVPMLLDIISTRWAQQYPFLFPSHSNSYILFWEMTCIQSYDNICIVAMFVMVNTRDKPDVPLKNELRRNTCTNGVLCIFIKWSRNVYNESEWAPWHITKWKQGTEEGMWYAIVKKMRKLYMHIYISIYKIIYVYIHSSQQFF